MNEYLTVKDVAFLEGVSVSTVAAWIREGKLQAERILARTSDGCLRPIWVVSEASLAEFELDDCLCCGRYRNRQDRNERKLHIQKLDELEEVLYDTTCLVQELRERIEKDWV